MARLSQMIEFDLSKPLGLGVDDTLLVQRINDPQSAAVLKAQYGLVRWRVVAVDGAAVNNKESLVAALADARGQSKSLASLTFETERSIEPEPKYVAEVQGYARKQNEMAALSAGSKRPFDASPDCAMNELVEEGGEKRMKIEEIEEVEEAKETLQLGSDLPTFKMNGVSVTKIVTGSCTWQLEEGDAARTDVAVRGCAAYTVLGCTTFDCGDIYAGVEELVGRFLATARGHSPQLADLVRLHTKVIPDVSEPIETLPRRVTASVLRSANRLGVSRVHLVNLHWWDWNTEGLQIAVNTLCDLRKRGIVGDIGITNVDTEHFDSVYESFPELACVQVNLSLVDRRPINSGLVEAVSNRGVALLAHGCLCGGLISDSWLGKEAPAVADLPPGQANNRMLIDEFGGWADFQALLRVLRDIADKKKQSDDDPTTIAQVAIAWTLALPGVSCVVLGARNARHVDQAAKAATTVVFDQEDLDALEKVYQRRGPGGPVGGLERDPNHPLKGLSGSGADGSLKRPVDRNESRAASEVHFEECTRRLGQLYETYRKTMPPAPPELPFSAPTSSSEEEEDQPQPPARATEDSAELDETETKPWMARSIYENLPTKQLVTLLRSFVKEIDNLFEDPTNLNRTRILRTFAAKMLASAEQALFVESRESSSHLISPRAPKLSHSTITNKAKVATSSAFRNRILKSLMQSKQTANSSPEKDGAAAPSKGRIDAASIPKPEECCLQ